MLHRFIEWRIIRWSVWCWYSPGTVVNLAPDVLETKIRESGKTVANLKADVFFMANKASTTPRKPSQPTMSTTAPPRLLSDQMVNIFFQEWAPLFPVLHRPTFLKVYAGYVARPEKVEDQQSIAQLHLVFSIAAVSAEVRSFEGRGKIWTKRR